MNKSHVGHMCVHWCETAEMEISLVKRTVEPLRMQRVIADVARDLGSLSFSSRTCNFTCAM